MINIIVLMKSLFINKFLIIFIVLISFTLSAVSAQDNINSIDINASECIQEGNFTELNHELHENNMMSWN